MLFLFAIPGSMRPFVFMLEQMCAALGLPVELLLAGYGVVFYNESP